MMPPKGKKCDRQSVKPQHIDNLPDNVIDDILMRLRLRDAVRTSILSKKWRYNWYRLPQLMFDRTLMDEIDQSIDPTSKFTEIVNHFMTLHLGPITKFSICASYLEKCPNIDNLIYIFSRNGIQHLVLKLPKEEGEYYKLPSSFFTCLQLRHLAIHNCSINPPPKFKGFDRLISLELSEVTLSPNLLESLISHSLLLEQLVLHIYYSSEIIKINAPKLRSFHYNGSTNYISLKNCPLLEKLSLKDTFGTSIEYDLPKFLEPLPALKHLHLDFVYVVSLSAGVGEVPARLPLTLKCLNICLGNFAGTVFALWLIRSTPFLQHIEIELCNVHVETLEDEGFSDVTFNHLRSVKLTSFEARKFEKELIRLLLAKSPVLVRMLIKPGLVDKSPVATVRALAELTKFPRASPKAEVVYETML